MVGVEGLGKLGMVMGIGGGIEELGRYCVERGMGMSMGMMVFGEWGVGKRREGKHVVCTVEVVLCDGEMRVSEHKYC